MAPRKSKGKRPASSSQFDDKRFNNAESADRFELRFKDRTVIFERIVVNTSFTSSLFTHWLYQNKLMVLMEMLNECFEEWVKEFYCNMFEVTAESFKTLVRGKTIYVDPDVICELLSLSRPNHPVYPIQNLNDCDPHMDVVASEICGKPTVWIPPVLKIYGLTTDYRMLNTFVVNNLEPRGHSSDVLPAQARLLYYLGTSTSVDIPQTIFAYMLKIYDEPRMLQLPYGALISKILVQAGCQVFTYERPISKRQKIDGRTRAMSDTHVRSRRQGEQAPVSVSNDDVDSIENRLLAVENAVYDQSVQIEQMDERLTSGFNDIRNQLTDMFNQLRHQ